jgi:hypothetical protein
MQFKSTVESLGDLSEIKNDATDMSVPPHSLEMRHLFVNVNVAALNTNWKHHAHSKIKTSSWPERRRLPFWLHSSVIGGHQLPKWNEPSIITMVNFLEYVSSQERKRKLRNVRTPKEKMPPEQKRGSLVCGTVKTPIGSRVAKIKSRVLKRITKNDSALHKVCYTFIWISNCQRLIIINVFILWSSTWNG